MDCRVVVEAAVPVYDVATADEAVRIAISKTGEMLNPDLNYVEINMGERSCSNCGEPSDPAFIAADEGLVALELEMTVFNVERDEHAARIARKEIGQRLENIPLEVLEVEVVETDEDEEPGDEESDESESNASDATDLDETDDGSPEASRDGGNESSARPSTVSGGGDSDDESLPEFEDLMDE